MATTTTHIQFGNGLGVTDLGAGVIRVDSGAMVSAIPYGTTLPATPANGDRAVLVDSVTNPTYQWEFRFNAGSTSPYKWELVGGNPLIVVVNTSETTTSGLYGDLATVGPSITMVRAGEYQCSFGANMYNNTAGSATAQSVAIAGVTAADVDCIYWVAPAANSQASLMRQRPVTLAAAGSQVACSYRVGGGGTGTFSNRWLSMVPKRVS